MFFSENYNKHIIIAAHTSFNPPEPPQDHWGLNNPLPKFEKTYKLGRKDGLVGFLFV
jgi:hypothetical protein